MKLQDIDEREWSAASPGTVYELLADGSTWPAWSGIDSFELRTPGDHGGESLNAIRVFRTGRVTSVERLVELVPGHRLSYALVSGLPLKDYRADVDLMPGDGGTMIRWHSTFTAKRAGTGWIYRRALRRFIAEAVRGLAVHAAEVRQTAPPVSPGASPAPAP
ncbi:MAG TPA: SRPBCC family protein [Acidimicrobiales bacterium]|nr:SRPBCC family protein [Acidimicrobiales bacterium]